MSIPRAWRPAAWPARQIGRGRSICQPAAPPSHSPPTRSRSGAWAYTGVLRGVRRVSGCGVGCVRGSDRNPNAVKRLIASGGEGVALESLMQRADIVIATTGVKGLIRPQWVRKGQVILALSNPDPEIEPLVAREQGAAFAADGKGINNVLAFPGLFKGALEAPARRFSDAMLMAAANTIAGLARGDELVPDPLDKALHEQVAVAVKAAAEATALTLDP